MVTRKLIHFFLLICIAVNSATAQHIPTPKEHFGFNIGDNYQLATFTQTEAYFKKLYNIDDDDTNKDVISMTLKGTQDQYHEYMDQYKENRIPDGLNKYKYVQKFTDNFFKRFIIK